VGCAVFRDYVKKAENAGRIRPSTLEQEKLFVASKARLNQTALA